VVVSCFLLLLAFMVLLILYSGGYLYGSQRCVECGKKAGSEGFVPSTEKVRYITGGRKGRCGECQGKSGKEPA